MSTIPRPGAVLFALCLMAVVCWQPAVAGTVAGVEVQGAPADPGASGPPATPRLAEVLIDFDDIQVGCVFMETSPLRDHYLGQGLRFLGPDATEGGAILHSCSNFGVSGYSGTNFFAFNAGASYPGGGLARLPETLEFVNPVVSVSILVGSGFSTGSASMTAYDAANNVVAFDTREVDPQLAAMTVTAPSILRVVLQGPVTCVFDDLRFTPGGIVPTAATRWGRLKALYR